MKYVQFTIPAGAFNRICPATEDWGILQFGVCPVPPRTGALYRLWVEYVQLPESWGILSVGLSSLAGAPCCTKTDTEYLQISWGILHLIEYVQLTIPAGAFNRICPATEDWGILQFRDVQFHQ